MEGKTNKEWYPYENFGSYFKLEDGALMSCPMNIDGTRDNSPCEVDPYEVWDLNEVIQELETKP